MIVRDWTRMVRLMISDGVARRCYRSLASCFVLLVLSACSTERMQATEQDVVDVAPASTRSITDVATFVDSIVLEQTDDHPIVRVSGLNVLEDGRLLLADVSEANVKIFSRSGRLVQVLGRQGSGPGEFKAPRFPLMAPDNRIIVGEGNGRITFFLPDGTLQKSIQIEHIGMVSSLSLLPNGDFLATRGFTGQEVLTRYDSTGKAVAEYLHFSQPPVTSERQNSQWLGALQFWAVVDDDTARVWSTLSDSIWNISLADGSQATERVTVPGYLAPRLPERQSPRNDPFSWMKAFHIVVAPVASDELLGFSMVQGTLHYGDPHVFVVRERNGPWVAVSGAPPVVAALGRDIYTLLHPGRDDGMVVLGMYRFDEDALR